MTPEKTFALPVPSGSSTGLWKTLLKSLLKLLVTG
jgi:hypothetical protein